MFASKFASSPHWLIRTWLSYLHRGCGPKKIPVLPGFLLSRYFSSTFEQFRDILKEIKLIEHCKTTCCYRATSPVHLPRWEPPKIVHSIIESGLIPCGKDIKKGRQTVFFTAVNPMSLHLHKQWDYDVTKPRIAVYKQT